MNVITITVGDVYSMVQSKDARVYSTLKVICRARPDGYMFTPRYQAGRWNGYVSLVVKSNQFPTGLLGLVHKAFTDKGYTVKIVGLNTANVKQVEADCLSGITLRDYQVEAANKLLQAGRGIAKMATNAGKTEVMAAVIKQIPGNHLVMVSKLDLMHQTAERLTKRLGEEVGVIGGGERKLGRITVCMIQTLYASPETIKVLGDITSIHIDECHHASSESYLDVLQRIPAKYRYGYSGTPLTYNALNDMVLIGATGRVLVDINNAYMIENGYSAPTEVIMLPVEDNSVYNWGMPYDRAYTNLVVKNRTRNAIIGKIASYHKDSVILIIVRQIAHGEVLAELIPDSVFVNGSDSIRKRREVLEAMKNGPMVVIATNIFDEGVDVPSINVVVIAAGGKEPRSVLQRVGRGLRRKDDGSSLVVYDFIDDTNMYLFEHSNARVNTYVSEGFIITEAAPNTHPYVLRAGRKRRI